MRRSLAWLGLLCWTCVALAASKPPPIPLFHAEYTLKRNGITLGVNTRSLRATADGNYIYASTTYATGIIAWFVKDQINEHSKWHFENGQIRPLEYVYNRDGGSKTRHVKLDFDWKQHVVTNTIDGKPWHMDVPDKAQDKLVYQLSIMYQLSQGDKDLHYKIADGGKLKDYQFEILGEEAINTPLGKIKAIKIQRIGDRRDTTVWCAPEYSYLPIRLEQQDTDGAELSMQLTSVQGVTKK